MSVRQLPSGNWQVDYVDEWGKRQRRTVQFEDAARAIDAQLRNKAHEARTAVRNFQRGETLTRKHEPQPKQPCRPLHKKAKGGVMVRWGSYRVRTGRGQFLPPRPWWFRWSVGSWWWVWVRWCRLVLWWGGSWGGGWVVGRCRVRR